MFFVTSLRKPFTVRGRELLTYFSSKICQSAWRNYSGSAGTAPSGTTTGVINTREPLLYITILSIYTFRAVFSKSGLLISG